MVKVFKRLYLKYFSDPEAVILFSLLVLGLAVILFMGEMLAPLLVSLVLAYLLEWVVTALHNKKIPRFASVIIVYLSFLSLFFLSLLVLLPILWHQMTNLFQDLPNMATRAQEFLYLMPEKFPDIVTREQVDSIAGNFVMELKDWGRHALTRTISSIPGLITLIVYLILVPVLIFFMLKDKTKLIASSVNFLPKKRDLLIHVWKDVDEQIGNYIRGKAVEIVIIGAITYVVFLYLHLKYAAILGTIVGFSVLIPYIGATVVTLPVALVGYFQFGWTQEFLYIMIAYGVIQAFDGNMLVPLLFSEVVNLHPVSIIVAILVFGGIWGFWGVFFAIPLATLVKAVVTSWPKSKVGLP